MKMLQLVTTLLTVSAISVAQGQDAMPDCRGPIFSHVLPAEHFFPQFPCGSDIVRAEVRLLVNVDSTGRTTGEMTQYLSLEHSSRARCAKAIAVEVAKAMSVAAENLPCQAILLVKIGK